jgi:Tat protein translocase TatB subunit
MPNLGGPEIIVILLVALIFLGPQRLPEVGRQIGGALRELRRVQGDVKAQLDEALRSDTSTTSTSTTSTSTAAPAIAAEPEAAHDAPAVESGDGEAGQPPPPSSFI